MKKPQGLPHTLKWQGDADGYLELLDQTLLPHEVRMRVCKSAEEVSNAIRELCVRGAPAIGVAAAYGLCLGTRPFREAPPARFMEHVQTVSDFLISSRPTAVNLAWAVRRAAEQARRSDEETSARIWSAMLEEAHRMAREDAEACRKIGETGAELIPDGGGVLTHCNAGALATVAYGTALSLLYVAHERGKRFRVFVDETRPLLQGARLTAYELDACGLDVTLLCDSAAASLIARGMVQAIVVGADRIAANGDTANKIGTYGLALAASQHDVPFYVAAPRSTFDRSLRDGSAIPIEERGADEVRRVGGVSITIDGIGCYNPSFDVTPAGLISGIVTEVGIIRPVNESEVRKIFDLSACKALGGI